VRKDAIRRKHGLTVRTPGPPGHNLRLIRLMMLEG